MDYIQITSENIDKEHICCALSNNTDIQVKSKKSWLSECFTDGLIFLKGNVRGKCFIEYVPADKAWNPIIADGYMHINCLWVSGTLKGHGYSSELLNMCIMDSKNKGKIGLCILSSFKKKPFLADPKFLSYKGFKVCDETDHGVQLWYLPFEPDAPVPCFKECAKNSIIDTEGYVLYYTNQCPFNSKYVPIIEKLTSQNSVPFKAIHISNIYDAQNAPTPVTRYALFFNGRFVTNETLNERLFLKLIKKEIK